MFNEQKERFLKRQDRSRKGSFDAHILSLIKLLNSKDNYYTTSSCSETFLLKRFIKNYQRKMFG